MRTYERNQDEAEALQSTLMALTQKRDDTIQRTMRLSQRLEPLRATSQTGRQGGATRQMSPFPEEEHPY